MTQGGVEWGMAGRPAAGETESGDAALVQECALGVVAAAIDGIGHGPEAARAARIAIHALNELQDDLHATARQCHRALEGTRGAALTLAAFDAKSDLMTWIGIGNVEARLLRARSAGGNAESLLLRPGIAGDDFPESPASTTPVERGDLLVLATDGLNSGFDADIAHEGSCEQIAQQLLERHGAPADDA